MIRWNSFCCTGHSSDSAAGDLLAQVVSHNSSDPALIIFFCAGYPEDATAKVGDILSSAWPEAEVVGATGAGVVGGGREMEGGRGVTALVAWGSGMQLRGRWLAAENHLDESIDALFDGTEDCQGVMVLADPFSMDVEKLLESVDRRFPDAPVFGGLLSGGREAGTHRLYAQGDVSDSGAVVVTFGGNVSVDVLVAQGCAPVGEPMIVTEKRGNLISRFDRGTPLEVVQRLLTSLDEDDRRSATSSLFAGLEVGGNSSVLQEEPEFLVRNIIGFDKDSGIMAIGALPEQYQIVQFHLRNRNTAVAELQKVLHSCDCVAGECGVLQFSCIGRGEALFGAPHAEVAAARELLGTPNIAGFFCNGEIGPVGGATHLHGYTTTFAVIHQRA